MRTLRSISIYCALFVGLTGLATAQSTTTDTVIVVPFENASGVPGLQWISEAFPEMLSQRLSSPSIFPLTRDDRLRAYDRAGIPAQLQPARATIYRLVEPMDVDYVVLGRYSFDGRSLTAAAQILDMQNRKLLPESQESGPLVELVNVQTALAWDLLHSLRSDFKVDKQAFTTSAPGIRLDAFENYIRGILDSTDADRINHFREAVRLSPTYNEAWLKLGRSYFDTHQYDQAITALGQVTATAPEAREANFFLGLAAYSVNDFSRAESAFNFVAVQLPLTEIFNNLGVTTLRLGDRKQALSYFRKAVESDPSDPDYHFNLALVLGETGNNQEAAQQLKECLNFRPTDAEAHSLLDSLVDESRGANTAPVERRASPPAGLATTPVPPVTTARLKSNYDENSYRQLFVGIQAAAEERLAKTDPVTHAQFHVSRGQELIGQGFTAEAQREFREATALDPSNPEAHAGLARTLEADNDISGARAEAEAALRLKIFIDPLLLLARLDLRDNKADAAAQSVDRALKLDPANPSALNLKRAVAAKLAQKAPPLPN